MEKRKEKSDLEQLLNSLIEKGWNPFGWEVREAKKWSYNNLYYWFDSHPELYHIRMLVSKESWLWQFVCENKLVKPQVYAWYFYREWMWKEVCKEDYEFRLIESSLKDESELEDFLLQNIKVD